MPPFQNIFRKKTPKKADPQSEPPGSSASSLELARSLQEEGRLDDALKEYEAVLKRLSSTGLDIKLRMKVQEDIAFLHLRRNDLSAAEEGFAMHLKMRRKDMGQGDRVTLGASLNLARVYIDQRKMGEAMKLICSALKAFDEKDGNDCREKFEAMACLADVYIHEGRAEDACTLYQKALSALESTSGPDDRHTLDTKYSLAMAHASMGRYIKAVDLLKEVLVTIEIDASGGNKGSLRARARLCRIYLKMSKIKDAEIELRRCFEEGEEMGLRTNKYVVEATQDLMALYRLDGKVDAIIPLHAWIKGENIVMPLSAASKMSTPSVIINNPPEKSGLILEEDSGAFNRAMDIRTAADRFELVVALLDTQCQKGNWVSLRLIERLNLTDQIERDISAPELESGTGHDVEALGAIQLSWKWHPNGTRMYDGQFFVFKNSPHLDVVIGVEYIVRERLLQANTSAFIPLTEVKKVKSDKVAIALAEEKRRQEKEALAARRAAAQQASQQPSNTHAQNAPQSG